jgi:LysM domain
MTTPPARGGHAQTVRPPGPARPPLILTENYAQLPSTAKVGLRAIPPIGTRPIDFMLDEDPPIMSQPSGGWVTTDRFGRKAITSWQGVQPYTLTMSGMFVARYQGVDDVEAFVRELESWFAPRGDFNAPRHVHVVGASPGTDREWVINDVTWKPSLRTADGARRIAPFDLTLMEFVDPDSVIRPTKRAADASNRKRIYTVKAGDTLTSIAKNRLGDARLADDIRRANLPVLADARNLKPNMQILLPAGRLHRS